MLVCDIGFECVVCDDHVVFLALPVEVRGHDNVGVHDGEEVPTGPTPDVNRRGAAVLQHLAVPWFYLQKEDFDLDVKGSSYS